MKKIYLVTLLLALIIIAPIPLMARTDINVSIVLPPPIAFSSPPELIVLPETYVYVVPGVEADFFFYNGWWWRQWEGRWYRSHYYDRGWGYYNKVPSFYFDVDPGWRGCYRDHDWYGHRWNYERIPTQQLQQNWKVWQTDRHWEKQGTWGVQSYNPRSQQQKKEIRQQRQQQYQQRPEVQQQRQYQVRTPQGQQQRQPELKQPKQQHQQQHQENVQQQQRQEQRPEAQQPQHQHQGKPERGEEEKQERR